MDEGPQWYPLNLHRAFLLFPMRIINLSSSPETQEHENIFFFLSFWLKKHLQQFLCGPRLPFFQLWHELISGISFFLAMKHLQMELVLQEIEQ